MELVDESGDRGSDKPVNEYEVVLVVELRDAVTVVLRVEVTTTITVVRVAVVEVVTVVVFETAETDPVE